MTERDLRKWMNENWTHRFAAYAIVVLTLSLIVQIVATILIGGKL